MEPRWSIIIPYYNEADYITGPLASAAAQVGTSFRLYLVDNRSTDGTDDVARRFLADYPEMDVVYLTEATPGPNYALARGFAEVTTPYVAFWDADTLYPPHYLTEAERRLSKPGVSVSQAIGLYGDESGLSCTLRRLRMRGTQILLSRQGHTGSYGQCFCAHALRAAGGPVVAQWPYVLQDHELIHRVFKQGRNASSMALWCKPSDRRSDNAHVRWTLFERLAYHLTPFAAKDWFFYRFLGPRFAARRMEQANLRQRDW